MRVLCPAEHVVAFYDGRIAGKRAWSAEPNWLDDGAYRLGVCSYAVVDGDEALVYDTHISESHARLVRKVLAEMGVHRVRVALSHWHADHVAGNTVFADCDIIASRLTQQMMETNRARLEGGTPPIRPLVMPNQIFEGRHQLTIGSTKVDLLGFGIHSQDGTVAHLPDHSILLAGDTLEDPITYVAEPDRLTSHLPEIERLARLDARAILPAHGAIEMIRDGGYGSGLIAANRRYVEKLLRAVQDLSLQAQDLATFIAEDLSTGAVHAFAPYEAVHRRNVKRVTAAIAGQQAY
eukprot:gene1491-1513_t